MNPTQNLPTIGADRTSRRVDGKPETDADRRFFDLRESGYIGPIDQDGYAVAGLAIPSAVVADVVTPAVTLRAAAKYLGRYGWIQGSYYDQTATAFTPAACTVGAIGMVCYGGPVDAPAQHFDDPGWADFEEAVAYLDGYLGEVNPSDADVYSFNDTPGRTRDQVIGTLRAAADEWDTRAASQPESGEVLDNEHAGYPHQPGTLYDCPACEAACFCTDGWQCVHCAIEAESADGDTTLGGGA